MSTSFQVPLVRSIKESDTNLSRNIGCRESRVKQNVRFFDKFVLYLQINLVLVAWLWRDKEDSEGLENKVAFVGWTNIDKGVVVSWNYFSSFLRWDGVEEDETVSGKLILH